MPASKSIKITPAKKMVTTPIRLSSNAKPTVKPKPKSVAAASKSKEQGKSQKAEPKKLEKQKKEKVIRDSFTMPKQEFDKIADLKKVCMAFGINIKKSELLRAGLHALSSLTPQQLKLAVSQVEKIKTGRPS